MADPRASNVTWPSHGPHGRHDWWTYLERGYLDPFQDVLREMPQVVDAPFDETGRTMLMYSVGNFPALVDLLIKAGADVNRRDVEGRPVWDFVPTSGPQAVEVWRSLIQAGLDVNARDPAGQTPLRSVCGVYLDPATNQAYRQSRVAIVRLLLDAGADANVVDRYRCSPLQAAVAARNHPVITLLRKAQRRR